MSLDTSTPALAHAVKILDRTNLVRHESRLNAGPLKRPLIDPCAQHSVSTESSKRQHLQLPGTTGTFPTNISGFDMHAPAADITSQIHPDASLLSCQAKSAPTAQSHSKVCTPSFSLNGSDMSSSFSEFAVRQDSAQRTKNDICAPLHNFVSQFNDNTLGNVSFCVAADGFASKTPVNAHVPRPDNLAGLSPAKSTTFLRPVQKVSIYDYNLVLAQHTGLEQQVQVLRDRLRAKTRECEECEQKVSQLAVDLALLEQKKRQSELLNKETNEDIQRCTTTIAALEKKVVATSRSRDTLYEQIDILDREIASVTPPAWRARYSGPTKAL